MKKHKLILPFALLTTTASIVSLVACGSQEDKTTCVVTFQVEGQGEVSANTLEVATNTKWINVVEKPTLTPAKYWKCGGLFINDQEVKDETVISQDCTIVVKFIHDENEITIINFEMADNTGSVEPYGQFWSGYTFGEIKSQGLAPKVIPTDLHVFNNGWYKDQECKFIIADETPIWTLETVYVKCVPNPEIFTHISFKINGGLGVIDPSDAEINVEKGYEWARVPRPNVTPVYGYVVDKFIVNGSTELVDDYVFNENAEVTIIMKKCTDEDDFKFDFKDGKARLVQYAPVDGAVANIVIPSHYHDVNGKVYPVTAIGDLDSEEKPVFNDGKIQTVSIPEGVNTVGKFIFGTSCTGVSSVSFPDSITTFTSSLFAGKNTVLTSLSFGKNVETLFAAIAKNLPNIGNITINKYNQHYYDGRYNGGSNCIIDALTKELIFVCSQSVLPTDLVSIGSYVFQNSTFESINIPASVRTIKANAFVGSHIKEVEFAQRSAGDTLEIMSSAFKDCANLKSIVLPRTTTKILDYAFQNSGLESFHLPRDVTRATMSTSISGAIIDGCKNLTSLSCDRDNPNYESVEECNIIVDKGVSSESQIRIGCKASVFPKDTIVSAIAGNAFRNCSISEIIIPEGYTTLYANAFYGCSNAKKVKLPSTMKSTSSIRSSAFSGCTYVEELDLTSYANLAATDISKLWTGTSVSPIFDFAMKGEVVVAKGTTEEIKTAWQDKLIKCGITSFGGDYWQIVEAEE